MLIIATSPGDILYGERQLESSDATECQRATAALQAISDAEYDLASTVAMDLRHDTDSDSDTELTVEESSTYEESNSSEDDLESDEALGNIKSYENYIYMPFGPLCVVVQSIDSEESCSSEESCPDNECVTEEALQSLMKIIPVANHICTKIVNNIALVQFAGQSLSESSKISKEVKFFWQFTERRNMWQVEGIDAELPSPFHPCALTWHRLTEMGEYVNVELLGTSSALQISAKLVCLKHGLHAPHPSSIPAVVAVPAATPTKRVLLDKETWAVF